MQQTAQRKLPWSLARQGAMEFGLGSLVVLVWLIPINVLILLTASEGGSPAPGWDAFSLLAFLVSLYIAGVYGSVGLGLARKTSLLLGFGGVIPLILIFIYSYFWEMPFDRLAHGVSIPEGNSLELIIFSGVALAVSGVFVAKMLGFNFWCGVLTAVGFGMGGAVGCAFALIPHVVPEWVWDIGPLVPLLLVSGATIGIPVPYVVAGAVIGWFLERQEQEKQVDSIPSIS